jgi:CHAT domain-containing protein/tetratricopeptide (TPR) repeat protein
VSKELADKLINAASAAAFLREQNGTAGWQTVSALKTEVDRLVGCDLNSAGQLAARLDQLAEAIGDQRAQAFADASRARVLHFTGSFVDAERLYHRAGQSLKAAGLKAEAAALQMQTVGVLIDSGRYQDALRLAKTARRYLAASEPVQLAQLENNIGNIYYRLDRYQQSLTHYERAHDVFSVAGDETMRAFVDFNRANVLAEMDRHAEALALAESAAAGFERAAQPAFAAEARFHIAYLQFLRGNYNEALAAYHEARDQLNALGSHVRIAWCDQEMAEVLLALNAFDDAAESAAAARSQFSQCGMPYEAAQASVVHALARMGQRQFDEAQQDLREARQVFDERNNKVTIATVDAYLAELALRRGDLREAEAYAGAALRVFSRGRLATRAAYARLLAARTAYEQNDLTKAARLSRNALAAVEGLFAPAVAYQCHHLTGCIERDRKRPKPALASFRRAVDAIEQMRGGIVADEFKATFLRDKMHAYEDAIAACLDAGDDELLTEAFRLVESSKSRALADLIARYTRESAGGSALKPETRERLAKLIEDLNWYSSQAGLAEDKGDQRGAEMADRYRQTVARTERQIARLFRRLELESPAFAEMQQMHSVTVADLCDTLQTGETVVEYFMTGEHVSAFVATRDGLRVARRIASKREVERLLMALRFQIEKFNYGAKYVEAHFSQLRRATNETLSLLYERIFAPLKSMIAGERLIIIPHGELHYIPFHALKAGDQYLIENYEVSYAPSASVLKLCRARRTAARAAGLESATAKKRNPASAPSSPDVATDGLLVALGLAESGTPSIDEEIRQLARLFPNAVTLTGEAATRENLFKAAPQARFLHLASHGFFRRDNPMFSFLKLADAQLNFYSLLDLQLNAEMVTLSACHTGVNKVFPGDELHGLMRGFLYAGAPSVVASLWAVSDHSTAEFMREMYTGIRAGASKRAALRRAQLAIKDAYGHPYYWAPFILMGDPE